MPKAKTYTAVHGLSTLLHACNFLVNKSPILDHCDPVT